jgi:pimeloyl-ACP methyl ester carboxylesterase
MWTCAALLGCCLQTACRSLDPDENAQRIAAPALLRRESLHAGAFVLTSFARIGAPSEPIDIYIEGDGHAWQSRGEPALDPTPREAMGLKLAAKDPAANVVYLARPCQFIGHDSPCDVAYWTGKRYSREVVAALNEAVSHYAALAPGRPLHLIGYSGGGTLAILIAVQRHDIASIRTVAGNLDIDEVTRLHAVSPMPLSVNPIDEAYRVAEIPQIHFSGGADRIVPPSIAERFARAAGGTCVQTRIIAGMGHESRWDERWPALLAQRPRCNELPT